MTGFLAFRSVNHVVRVFQRDVQVERVVLLVVLKRGAGGIPVVSLVVSTDRRTLTFVLGWKDVFAGDSAVRRGERGVVVVERRTPLVVHHAPRVELGLTRLLALFQFLDATCDGFDSASDALLDEVGGEVGFLTQLTVQGVFSR